VTSIAAIDAARRGDFTAASAATFAEASEKLEFGFRTQALGDFELAGYWARCAGDLVGAENAYDQALTLHEHDLQHQPLPRLVASYLAHLPQLAGAAALVAVDRGRPERALAIAELGRCRALGLRTGSRARVVPAGADPARWEAYIHTWRHVIAGAIARTDAAGGETDPDLAALTDELVASGVARSALLPVVAPVTIADARAALAGDSAVVYSIRARDRCALILLDASGARTIAPDVPPDEGLVSIVANALGPAVRRVIWVPHASLVAIPVGALLAQRAAVMYAPSLTVALAHAATVRGGRRAVAIEGRGDPGTALTTGAGAIIQPLAANLATLRPTNGAELAAALAPADVAVLSCHGIYDHADPLATALVLAGAGTASLAQLYDELELAPGMLALVAACDAGTAIQDELNEPLGLPMTLLDAGAQACIGAAWPVRRFPTVALFLRLVRELAAGAASPDALAVAIRWLRTATKREIAALFAGANHPAAKEYRFLQVERDEVAFPAAVDWAGFIHWGGPWQLA